MAVEAVKIPAAAKIKYDAQREIARYVFQLASFSLFS